MNANRERGNALIMLAIFLPAVIAATGLVIDYGHGVWARTQLQKAADAAALAGASFLPNQTQASQQATRMINSNYGVPASQTFTVTGYRYTVQLTDNVPTFLMRIFDHDAMSITAQASALARRPVGIMKGTGFPSAIINPNLNNDPSDDLKPDNYGRPYVINYGPLNFMVQDWANGSLKYPSGDEGGNSNGWKAWLGLRSNGTYGNAGANDIKYNIINGWPGTMLIGDIVPMRTGNVTGPPEQGRQELLGSNPTPWNNFDPRTMGNNRRIVYVPIVHLIHVNRQDAFTAADFYAGADWDRTQVVVNGFAPFFLLTAAEEKAYANSLGLDIKKNGWMVGFYVPGIVTDHYLPSNGAPDMGMYQPPRLVD